MCLRITLLSEMCNPEGTSLNMTLLQNKATNRVNSRFWWPHQTKPGAKYWTDWISYLLKKYCVPNSHHLQQQYQLGKLLTAYNNRNSHTNIDFSPSLQEVYNTKHTTHHYCEHTGTGTYSIIPNISVCIDTIPADTIPIILTNNIFNYTVQRQCISRASRIAKTFQEYVKVLPTWKHMLIQKTKTSYPNSLAVEFYAKRPLIIATGGTKTDTISGGGGLSQ